MTEYRRSYTSLVPGPCEIDDRVRAALSRQVVSHLHDEWRGTYLDVVQGLKRLLGTEGDAYLMLNSATGVMESVITALCAPGERMLVLSNGYFGHAMAKVAQNTGREAVLLEFPDEGTVDPEVLREHLGAAGDGYRAVGVVHSESSTGTLNDLRAIASVVKEFDLPVVVDAVSSAGGVDIRGDEWNIDFVVTGGQKALGSITGAGILTVAPGAWRFVREGAEGLGHYLNLRIWKEAQEENPIHPYPWSMSESMVWATEAALESIAAEGADNRFARHREVADYYRQELPKLGFEPFVPEEIATPTVVSVRRHDAISVDDLATVLREEHGILIGKGIYSQRGKLWRIGNMGVQSSFERAESLLVALRTVV